MAALLVSLSIMALLMTAIMPVWRHEAQREKEAELVFRGQQYVHAITLFQRKSGPGVYPPNFDLLVQQRYLRKKYKDPITNGDFQPVSALLPAGAPAPGSVTGAAQPGQTSGFGATATGTPASPLAQTFTLGSDVPGGIAGVASKSTDQSIRIYNGQTHYNEWVFRVVPQAQTPGGGAAGPNGRGRGGTPNGPPGPGVGPSGLPAGAPPGRGFRGGPQGDPFAPGGRQPFTLPDGRTGTFTPPGADGRAGSITTSPPPPGR